MVSREKYAAFQDNGVKYVFKKKAINCGRHLVSEMEKRTVSTNYNSLQQILSFYM